MEMSAFGTKLTSQSGILQLMDDLGKKGAEGLTMYGLGGGNPARIPEVEAMYRKEMETLLHDGDSFEQAIAHYDAPQGRMNFVHSIATSLSKEYGWNLGEENVAITNGSQSAMFYLFNLLSGTFTTKEGKNYKKTILFPLMPEYVGYADQGIERDTFVSVPSLCTYFDNHTFKYQIDFEKVAQYLDNHSQVGVDGMVGALCISRPTNPSGNVLTDEEVMKLSSMAQAHHIPLIIDSAYGLPFPRIVFTENATPFWNENIILSMSLSKIGLPAIRTGIVVAQPEMVQALSNINAIAALASGSMGQVLAGPLFDDGTLIRFAHRYVQPFYKKKSAQAQQYIQQAFEGKPYWYHVSEGAIFLWLYLPDLTIPTIQFYQKLKEKGVITVPGEYSFFGHEDQQKGLPYPHPHYDKCLRINYSGEDACVRKGIEIISTTYDAYRR